MWSEMVFSLLSARTCISSCFLAFAFGPRLANLQPTLTNPQPSAAASRHRAMGAAIMVDQELGRFLGGQKAHTSNPQPHSGGQQGSVDAIQGIHRTSILFVQSRPDLFLSMQSAVSEAHRFFASES